MLLLRGYEHWRGISFIGYHFSAVARGRKLYIIALVCLGSAFVFLCPRVLVCVIQLIFLVLCKNCVFLSWSYWFLWWGHWPGFRYTAGRRCLPIVPWSWLFTGTFWPDRVPWKTLTKCSGCLPLCVKIPVSICQSKVCLTSGILFSCERWLLFFGALPRPC